MLCWPGQGLVGGDCLSWAHFKPIIIRIFQPLAQLSGERWVRFFFPKYLTPFRPSQNFEQPLISMCKRRSCLQLRRSHALLMRRSAREM